MKNLLLAAIMLTLCVGYALAKKVDLAESPNLTTSEKSLKSSDESKAEQGSSLWLVSAKEKSGGFLGFEMGVGEAYLKIGANVNYLDFYRIATYYNVIFGYQHYFLDVPWAHLGFRISANVGINAPYSPSYLTGYDEETYIKFSVNVVQYGADLGVMWDFVDSANHTLGIYIAPLGFEGNTVFGKSAKGSIMAPVYRNKLTTTTKFSYKLSAGLQYMYKHHHLLFFAYRFLYNNQKIPKGTADIYDNPGASVNVRHSGLFGYAYKF